MLPAWLIAWRCRRRTNLANDTGGIAGNNGPRRNVARDNAAHAHHGACAYGHTFDDDAARADPRPFADAHWSHGAVRPVVSPIVHPVGKVIGSQFWINAVVVAVGDDA